jgi:transcriptional regulator with XRE-family HTH domain
VSSQNWLFILRSANLLNLSHLLENTRLMTDICVWQDGPVFTDLGQSIRALREADPWWSQQELAEKSDVSIYTVVRAEAGKNLRFANLTKIASALKKKTGQDVLGNSLSNADERLNAPRDSSILAPSPTIPTMTEGSPMREQIEQVLGALGQVPTRHRQDFANEVSDLAARFRLGLPHGSAHGGSVGKRHRSSGTG